MTTHPSPWTIRARELLADGNWHELEPLLNELAKLVPPGRALRRNENARLKARNQGPAMRTYPRSKDYLIASGARRIVREALLGTNSKTWIERETQNGRSVVRLRPRP